MQTSTDAPRTRVRVQHADGIVAAGLSMALHQHAEFELCPDMSGSVDLIVCDYGTGMTLVQRDARAAAASGGTRVLVLTTQDREQAVRHALEVGVHGYVLNGSPVDELINAVRTVARGQRFLSAEVAQRMAESMTREALTPREAQVLHLLADGHCNKAVARQLDIALGTVKAHVKAILAKLEVTSRTQAVSIATQRGLVVLDPSEVH
jgi:DNA-binding NarL/FixJ family response regulator